MPERLYVPLQSLHARVVGLNTDIQTLLHMLKNDRLATLQPTLHPSTSSLFLSSPQAVALDNQPDGLDSI